MYFNKCDACGAFLAPGEHCDCLERKHSKEVEIAGMLTAEKDGQMVLKEAVRSGAYSWLR